MELYYFLLLLFLYVYGSAVQPVLGIANGVDATYLDAPYVVSIRVDNYHRCGGSIISFLWVLTAGHCISRSDLVYSVLFGTLESYRGVSAPEYNTREVVRKVFHPNFGPLRNVVVNDVGLIMVNEAFTFSNRFYNVRLPESFAPIPITRRALLLGWGCLDETTMEFPNVLQKVRIPVHPALRNEIHNEISENEFCAGCRGYGACLGDSGSPLIYNQVQIGIASWSYEPCAEDPSIFQAVSHHVDLINSIIQY